MITFSPPAGDATAAFKDALRRCLKPTDLPHGCFHSLHLTEGIYRFDSPLTLDLSGVGSYGWRMLGQGQATRLIFPRLSTTPALTILGGGPATPVFHVRLGDFGVSAQVRGPAPAVMFGSGDMRDQFNVFDLDGLCIVNGHNVEAGPALEVNGAYQCWFGGAYGSTGKHGGLRLRQCRFCTFWCSPSCTQGPYLHLSGPGEISNCTFISPDIEGAPPPPGSVGLLIDSPHARNNVFSAPLFSNLETGVNAVAGNNNQMLAPEFSASVKRHWAGTVGVRIM